MTDVRDLRARFKEHRARLDYADEARRLSSDQADYADVLDSVETMIEDLTKATLRHLGEPLPEGSKEALVQHLSLAIVRRPERFADGASVRLLSDLLGRQEQNLRDIEYLRQGFGLGSGRAKPADMKWEHPSSVASDVLDTFGQLFESLRVEGADVKRLNPEIKFDLGSTRLGIIGLLEKDLGPRDFMVAVVGLGASQAPVAGWDAFRELSYEAELERRDSFFIDVTTRESPTAPLAGFYVGVAYPSRGGETVADLQLMGSAMFEADTDDGFAHVDYTPKDGYAHSEVLASIYSLAYAPGGLGNAADYTLCLGWGTYLSRACARRYLVETARDFIGLGVGFSGGDWVDLGWVRAPRLQT